MSTDVMHCYFCDSDRVQFSLSQRTIHFGGRQYRFVYCKQCRGFSLFPRLTNSQLFELYSSDYVDQDQDDSSSSEDSSLARFSDLKSYLHGQSGTPGRVFLDYGCGANPVTLQLARESGFIPRGMELSADVREMAELNTGVRLLSRDDILDGNEFFDIIFLGDVLEHLVDPVSELKFLRTRLTEGGTLLAQGPLQGAITLTHLVVRLFAWTMRGKTSSYPPYHVSLASSLSMKKLMNVSGFQLSFLKTFEVDWPAPSLDEVRTNFTPRNLILFSTKKIDKLLARILPKYGTRYFLACSSNAQS